MQRWEFALLTWSREKTEVGFTHHESWRSLAPEDLWDTLRRLGDEGWEMSSATEEPAIGMSLIWFKRPQR